MVKKDVQYPSIKGEDIYKFVFEIKRKEQYFCSQIYVKALVIF